MGEWKDTPLSEVADLLPGYAFKGMDFGVGTSRGVKIKDVQSGVVAVESLDALDVTSYNQERIKKYRLNAGDHLITMTGNLGRVATIPESAHEIYLNQRVAKLLPKPNVIEDFLLYVIKSSDFIDYCITHADSETAQPNISAGTILEYEFALPPEDEQRAIASVLSSLDAKIDLLHRQNKTLEAMAETLFRQWFVEEAEEGWEEYVLTDIASHCKDSVNPGQHPTRIYHHYSLPAYDEGRKPSPELGDTIKSTKYVVPENAVLISKLNPRFPRVWPVRDKKHEHPISSTEFQVFVPKKAETFGFLYCYLSSKAVQDELASAASGTSGSHQRVSPDDIKGLSFQAKSKQQLEDFSKVVDPLLKKIETNKDQVANLTKLRDTLLPKLMSGEVRVESNHQ